MERMVVVDHRVLLRGFFMSSAVRAVMIVLEPMTGIEPAPPAWEAGVLPLNYIGRCGQTPPHPVGYELTPDTL